MEYGTPAQKARFLPKIASSEEVWAQGWSRAERGLRHGGDHDDGAARRRPLRDQGPEDLGVARRVRRLAVRHCSAPTRSPSATTASRFVLVPLDTPGVTVRPIAQLDGETGFAEVFFDDARVPVENRLGARGRGLERRDGDGGLRARADAAQPGALPGHRGTAGRPCCARTTRAPRTPCAMTSCAAGWTPRRTRSTRTAPSRGCSPAARSAPRRASTRSSGRELDIRMHELALADPRRPRRAAARGARRAGRRHLARRLPLRALGSDLRRHQRDPAQHRRRAHSRDAEVAMDFAFTATTSCCSRRPCATSSRRSARPRRCARSGRAKTGRSPALWKKLAEIGVAGLLAPEAQGGMGFDETTLVLLLEEAGRAALPEPVIGTAAVGGAAAARARRRARERVAPAHRGGRGDRRGGPSREPVRRRMRTSPTCCCSPHGDELHALRRGDVTLTRAARQRSRAAHRECVVLARRDDAGRRGRARPRAARRRARPRRARLRRRGARRRATG